MLASLFGISWATPFLVAALYGCIRYFSKNDEDSKNKINWNPLEAVCITVAIYFVSQFLGAIIVFVLPLIRGWSLEQTSTWLDNNPYGQFLLVLAIEAITVGLLYYFIKRRKSSFKSIGLKKPQWRDLTYVLLGYAAYFMAFSLVLIVVKQAIPSLNTNQQQQLGFDNAKGLQLPFVFISLVILPPFVEELLVRGFLYSGLKKGMPIIWAVLITSAIFATAHLQAGSGAALLWPAALDTFVLSLTLIYLKEKTGSLAACIGLHMLKNFVAFLGLFVFHWM